MQKEIIVTTVANIIGDHSNFIHFCVLLLAIHSCLLLIPYILIAEDTSLHEGLFDSYSSGGLSQHSTARTNQLYDWEYVGSKPQVHA